jgi:hypothetical protein
MILDKITFYPAVSDDPRQIAGGDDEMQHVFAV